MLLPGRVLSVIESALGQTITSVKPVGGGDIHEAFQLISSKLPFFLKLNRGRLGFAFLQAEAEGLQALSATNTIALPRVLCAGALEPEGGFLLMEFIEIERPEQHFWPKFAKGLAQLHQSTQNSFGWKSNNFIGSLHQSNTACTTWAAFFRTQRLQPQMELAKANALLDSSHIRTFEKLLEKIPGLVEEEAPALIHGDLWSGNFLCKPSQLPVLIDPAPSYSSREMDLAMARLFGGFDQSFFEAYQAYHPLQAGWKDRTPLYQLYYLLVHLNLFGKSYLSRIEDIIRRYA